MKQAISHKISYHILLISRILEVELFHPDKNLLVSSCLLEEFASCFANVQSCLSLMITDVGIWQANEIPTITFDLVDQDLYGNSTFKWTNIANSLQIVQNKCWKFRKLLLFVVRHCLFTFYKTENDSLWLSLLTNFIV